MRCSCRRPWCEVLALAALNKLFRRCAREDHRAASSRGRRMHFSATTGNRGLDPNKMDARLSGPAEQLMVAI